jgi:DNA processing protein
MIELLPNAAASRAAEKSDFCFLPSLEESIVGLAALRQKRVSSEAFSRLLKKAGGCIGSLITAPSDLKREFADFFFNLDSRSKRELLRQDILRWQKSGIFCVTLGSKAYPALLTEISDPPVMLFFQGEGIERINTFPIVSIVGSRKATEDGRRISHLFARAIAEAGGAVCSGLAYGVDANAHKGALDAKCDFPTLAVLGGGLDKIYPAANRCLAQSILDRGGLLLSQFEPGQSPLPRNFLNRNRVVSGLSLGVIVIQAASRSGSLATARYALEQGRELAVVPSSILDPAWEGSNALLREGAHVLTATKDLKVLFPFLKIKENKKESAEHLELTEQQRAILRELAPRHSVHIDDLLLSVKCSISEMTFALHELETKSLVEQLTGNEFALKKR